MRLYPLGIVKEVFIFVFNSIDLNIKSIIVRLFSTLALIFICCGIISSSTKLPTYIDQLTTKNIDKIKKNIHHLPNYQYIPSTFQQEN